MAYLVTNAIQDGATLMGRSAYYGAIATGGSTGTFIDTKLGDTYEDESLVNATLIVVRDAAGLSGAPEGEFSRISAYNQATYTGTIDTLTAAIAAGDSLMIVLPAYPLEDWRRVLNSALQDLGYIPLQDVSLTAVDGTRLYTLPVACKTENLVGVEIENTDGDWITQAKTTYFVTQSAPGTTAVLSFVTDPPAGTIRITYMGPHPRVWNYSDPISEYLPPRLVKTKLAANMFAWFGVTEDKAQAANRVMADLEVLERKHRPYEPHQWSETLTFART